MQSQYIVQFVGFKTNLNDTAFIQRWTPFATSFKNAGILSIDLYKVSNNNHFTFISQNIWDSTTYFQNFPSGVAGSGSGGGISVTQFGGYWISENELDKPIAMNLLFTNNDYTLASVVRKRCSENVNYQNQVLLPENNMADMYSNASGIIICNHLKTI